MGIPTLPSAKVIQVDTRGAVIVEEESPDTRDSRGIYLPNYIEPISHIAIDIGGSLAKVVYFTRSPQSQSHPPTQSQSQSHTGGERAVEGQGEPPSPSPSTSQTPPPVASPPTPPSAAKYTGALTPLILDDIHPGYDPQSAQFKTELLRRASQLAISQSTATSTSRGPYSHALPTSSSHDPSSSTPSSSAAVDANRGAAAAGAASSHRSSNIPFPGGLMNFEKFETERVEDCVDFVLRLIEKSAERNGVTVEEMKKGVRVIATGGGAHLHHPLFTRLLGMKVSTEDEMDCLITGLKFISQIPDEVYFFSDELIHRVAHGHRESGDEGGSGEVGKERVEVSTDVRGAATGEREGENASKLTPASSQPQPKEMERPSPTPPLYTVSFAPPSPTAQLPCLLVNIGSGVSIIHVREDGGFERVSGTSLGGGTLWGLLSLLTGAGGFDEMLSLSEKGDNANVDMLVGDIYGSDYTKMGLKSGMIASSFGKVFRKGRDGKREKKEFRKEDISKSLLYAISNNIGQIAYMNAEKYNVDKIYFGGFFIRGHAATIATLSYAIRFWSRGTKRALFLRHEGFLGSIGAWIKNVEYADGEELEPELAPGSGGEATSDGSGKSPLVDGDGNDHELSR